MPWGELSVNYKMNPMNSDDGPIVWARPGEQMIPTSHLKDQQLLNSNATNFNQSNTGEKKKKYLLFFYLKKRLQTINYLKKKIKKKKKLRHIEIRFILRQSI